MAAGDLTTLDAVKAYAPGLAPATVGPDDTFDLLLARLISSTSAQFVREAGRPILQAAYVEVRNGNDKQRLTPKRYPVTAVTSVKVDGSAIAQQATVGGDGWVLLDDAVYLVGSKFNAGTANVELSYTAGFSVVPTDVEQAVIKMTVLQFYDRKRIGISSTSQAGESAGYSDAAVLAYWRSVVNAYRAWEV